MNYCNCLVVSLNPIYFVHKNGKKYTQDIGKALTWDSKTFTKQGLNYLTKIIKDHEAFVCKIKIIKVEMVGEQK